MRSGERLALRSLPYISGGSVSRKKLLMGALDISVLSSLGTLNSRAKYHAAVPSLVTLLSSFYHVLISAENRLKELIGTSCLAPDSRKKQQLSQEYDNWKVKMADTYSHFRSSTFVQCGLTLKGQINVGTPKGSTLLVIPYGCSRPEQLSRQIP